MVLSKRQLQSLPFKLERGRERVLAQRDQDGRDGRHFDGEEVAPVDVGGLREMEPRLQHEANILTRLPRPAQRLQHHL